MVVVVVWWCGGGVQKVLCMGGACSIYCMEDIAPIYISLAMTYMEIDTFMRCDVHIYTHIKTSHLKS